MIGEKFTINEYGIYCTMYMLAYTGFQRGDPGWFKSSCWPLDLTAHYSSLFSDGQSLTKEPCPQPVMHWKSNGCQWPQMVDYLNCYKLYKLSKRPQQRKYVSKYVLILYKILHINSLSIIVDSASSITQSINHSFLPQY